MVALVVLGHALVVRLALGTAAGDGVGLGEQAGQAVTDRVAEMIDLTGGAGTAGRGIAWVGPLNTPVEKSYVEVYALKYVRC